MGIFVVKRGGGAASREDGLGGSDTRHRGLTSAHVGVRIHEPEPTLHSPRGRLVLVVGDVDLVVIVVGYPVEVQVFTCRSARSEMEKVYR